MSAVVWCAPSRLQIPGQFARFAKVYDICNAAVCVCARQGSYHACGTPRVPGWFILPLMSCDMVCLFGVFLAWFVGGFFLGGREG